MSKHDANNIKEFIEDFVRYLKLGKYDNVLRVAVVAIGACFLACGIQCLS